MDPRAGLDGRKISSPPGLDPGPSSFLYRLCYFLIELERNPTLSFLLITCFTPKNLTILFVEVLQATSTDAVWYCDEVSLSYNLCI